ncbi:ABC transporter permease [Fulvivirga sp. 2943]|uniref:ABC transporter permease n=2 Tax=Fulvivirga sediminis TaxID=2803949 RepID=A0A937JZS4_9BACT|nr:ABC transporter permease [Fulvivirga sediminis]
MQQHNLKITYRTFLRYKSSFLINLFGLATGLTCAILIFLWVNDELSTDKFHEHDAQLYHVMLNHEEDGGIRTDTSSPGLLAEALEEEVPEIKMAVEDSDPLWFGENFSLSDGEKFHKASGKFAGDGYFEMYSFPMKYGQADHALKDKKSVVISESLATRLFGSSKDALNKSLEWKLLHFTSQATVTGVFKNLPTNSTQQFDFVLPFSLFKDILGDGLHWGNYNTYTSVLVTPGTNINQLNQKLADFIKNKNQGSNVSPMLVKFSDLYLYGQFENGQQAGGRIMYVRLFSVIGLFVLIIASINFMNLSTARASRRLKEIGVKKSLGAGRKTLIAQYLTEALVMAFLALIFAIAFTYALLPQFNQITGKVLTLTLSPTFIGGLIGIVIFTGLLAGSYPALYLSGFKPINILKGHFRGSATEAWTRKGLVVFQFVLSIVMVVSVLIVYKQINFALTKNIGYDRNGVILVPMEGKATENIESYLTRLGEVPGVEHVSASSHTFTQNGSFTTGVSWPGKTEGTIIKFEQSRAYYDIQQTLGFEMAEGRSFSNQYGDETSKIIFNEAAIEAMGLEDPIGKKVNLWGEEKEIIGVMKNFNYSSLHSKVEPMLFHFKTDFLPNILIKLNTKNPRNVLSNLREWYKINNPGYNFDYTFLDTAYEAQYKAEERVSLLARYFAGVAIVISCLGLFALAAFTAERRQKEIGVRKILGASHFTIVRLLSADFTKMVLLAIVIGLPVSYVMANFWLQNFAYHINLEWWYFAISGAAALVIAWLTVSFQTIKAAQTNPSASLKEE